MHALLGQVSLFGEEKHEQDQHHLIITRRAAAQRHYHQANKRPPQSFKMLFSLYHAITQKCMPG